MRKWRRRWCAAPGVASLRDAQRCGRPPVFSAVQVAKVKATAHATGDAGLPMSRWSCRSWRGTPSRGDLRVHLDGDGAPLAVEDASNLAVPVVDLITDPTSPQSTRVLDLTTGCGTETLGHQVISADEKTSIRPVSLHPRCRRQAHDAGNHDYDRGGAVAPGL